MPELPEVETVCKLMRKALLGQTVTRVKAFSDEIVFKSQSSIEVEAALPNQVVTMVGRKGKYFWLQFSSDLSLIGHLGMSGWVEELERDQEPPRFSKLILGTEDGKGIAITDARRLGRIWMTSDPLSDPVIKRLGLDAREGLPKAAKFEALFRSRKAPIKAILLDQGVLAGIGNYLADEILYHAKISPLRAANELSSAEYTRLRSSIQKIIATAIDADADENRFPSNWLFHHRWGGKRGPEKIGSNSIVRKTVGGRTTAWVPNVQK